MRRTLLVIAFFLGLPVFADEGATVTVTVTNIPVAQGNLLIGLYDSAASFLVKPSQDSPKIPLKSTGSVRAKFIDLPPGNYSIAVIQDLNENGRLDKNFIGIPKEPLAFSVIDTIPRGKPKFDACSFRVEGEDVSMVIPLTVE